jgi:hypothetical protein
MGGPRHDRPSRQWFECQHDAQRLFNLQRIRYISQFDSFPRHYRPTCGQSLRRPSIGPTAPRPSSARGSVTSYFTGRPRHRLAPEDSPSTNIYVSSPMPSISSVGTPKFLGTKGSTYITIVYDLYFWYQYQRQHESRSARSMMPTPSPLSPCHSAPEPPTFRSMSSTPTI